TGDEQAAEQVGQRLRVRGGHTVAALDFEIQVGQRRRFGTLEIDGQAEPQPQLGDVDGEEVQVHAVEVVLNDVELAAVDCHTVQAARGEQHLAQAEEFLHHAEQVRAAAAGRVTDLDAS